MPYRSFIYGIFLSYNIFKCGHKIYLKGVGNRYNRMNSESKLVIRKRAGEEGFKNFSIRVPNEIVNKLDEISQRANVSRNELISIMLDYAIEHCEIK